MSCSRCELHHNSTGGALGGCVCMCHGDFTSIKVQPQNHDYLILQELKEIKEILKDIRRKSL